MGSVLRLVRDVILSGSGSITFSLRGLYREDADWAGTIGDRIAGLGPIAEAGLVRAANTKPGSLPALRRTFDSSAGAGCG